MGNDRKTEFPASKEFTDPWDNTERQADPTMQKEKGTLEGFAQRVQEISIKVGFEQSFE